MLYNLFVCGLILSYVFYYSIVGLCLRALVFRWVGDDDFGAGRNGLVGVGGGCFWVLGVVECICLGVGWVGWEFFANFVGSGCWGLSGWACRTSRTGRTCWRAVEWGS